MQASIHQHGMIFYIRFSSQSFPRNACVADGHHDHSRHRRGLWCRGELQRQPRMAPGAAVAHNPIPESCKRRNLKIIYTDGSNKHLTPSCSAFVVLRIYVLFPRSTRRLGCKDGCCSTPPPNARISHPGAECAMRDGNVCWFQFFTSKGGRSGILYVHPLV